MVLDEGVAASIAHYHAALLRRWPDIAAVLVRAGFDDGVRRANHMLPGSRELDQNLSGLWQDALGMALDRCVDRLSGPVLQLLFNLPALGIIGYTGWLTLREFIRGTFFPSGFFLHAALAIAIVLFLSFFLLQVVVRFLGAPPRISQHAFDMIQCTPDALQPLYDHPVYQKIETLLALSRE